jgi:hypothetical protein
LLKKLSSFGFVMKTSGWRRSIWCSHDVPLFWAPAIRRFGSTVGRVSTGVS